MKRYYLIGTLGFLLTCCISEIGYVSMGVFVNQSGRALDVRFYEGNDEVGDYFVSIPHNEQRLVYKGTLITFPGILRSNIDSIVVRYEGSKTAVHYGFNKQGNNPRAIKFDEDRNLFNASNYIHEKLVDKKRHKEGVATYTFTEVDYLNAN